MSLPILFVKTMMTQLDRKKGGWITSKYIHENKY